MSGAVQSDHLALITSFPVVFTNPPRFRRDHRVWRPDLPHATDSAKRRFHAATAERLKCLLDCPPSDEQSLEAAFNQVATVIREQAQRHLPAVRQGKRRSCASTRIVMRRCKALRNMLAQIERLSQGVICITSTAFQSAVSNLRDRGIAMVDPTTGERSWDPSVVKEQVAQKVGSLFSTRVTLPAEGSPASCTGLCGAEKGPGICLDARCSGRPAWWDSMYSDNARKPGGAELFQSIMRPAEVDEMLSCLRRTGSGKSPGFDLVSVDLLKIVCEDSFAKEAERGISASVVLSLCNKSLSLGVVPKHAKTGVICMIPKGAIGGTI